MKPDCCGTLRVYLLAGQSNAVGAAGNQLEPDTPDMFLVGENAGFNLPYHPTCYAEQIWNIQNQFVARELDLGPIQPYPLPPFEGRFGVEPSLGRCLNSIRPSHWSPHDEVVLIKWAAGGAGIDRFLSTDTTGSHDSFTGFVQSKIDQLKAICPDVDVSLEDMFWLQGEANATNGSSTYLPRFQQLMSEINANIGSFRPIFANLKRQDLASTAAYDAGVDVINANMLAAGYVTVPTQDLNFLVSQFLHYDAPGYIELGNRLCYASRAN